MRVEVMQGWEEGRGLVKYSNHVEIYSRYCRVPPTKGLHVMVVWGHGWRALKRAGTERVIHYTGQWWGNLFRCRIDLLNFSTRFNIIAPYMEFLHLNWYIAELGHCFYLILKGAVVVTLCQNETDVKFPMDNVVVNVHWKFYFCLILAEGLANCSFQGLIIAILINTTQLGLPINNAQYIRLTNTQANGGSQQYIS